MIKCYSDIVNEIRYIPVPKCASTSVLSVLLNIDDSVEEIHRRKPKMGRWTPDGWPTFAVIRDPWTRLVSTWRNKVYRPHRSDAGLISRHGIPMGTSFADFVAIVAERGVRGLDGHIVPQVDYLRYRGEIPYNDIGFVLYEHLDEDWAACGGLDAVGPLPRLNATEPEDNPYTDDLHIKVRTLYHEDLVMWRRVSAARARRIADS